MSCCVFGVRTASLGRDRGHGRHKEAGCGRDKQDIYGAAIALLKTNMVVLVRTLNNNKATPGRAQRRQWFLSRPLGHGHGHVPAGPALPGGRQNGEPPAVGGGPPPRKYGLPSPSPSACMRWPHTCCPPSGRRHRPQILLVSWFLVGTEY